MWATLPSGSSSRSQMTSGSMTQLPPAPSPVSWILLPIRKWCKGRAGFFVEPTVFDDVEDERVIKVG